MGVYALRGDGDTAMKMKWAYNTFDRNGNGFAPTQVVRVEHPAQAEFGEPQATNTFTVDELKAMNLIGVYVRVPRTVRQGLET